jgi:hypothetical protein
MCKITYKSIRTSRHTDTNETFRSERRKVNVRREVCQCGTGSKDVVRYIKRILLCCALGEDNRLRHVELLDANPVNRATGHLSPVPC